MCLEHDISLDLALSVLKSFQKNKKKVFDIYFYRKRCRSWLWVIFGTAAPLIKLNRTDKQLSDTADGWQQHGVWKRERKLQV